MKKVLGFLGVLIFNSSVGLTTIACSTNYSSIREYNSVGMGLKSLDLESFAAVKEDLGKIILGIKDDVVVGLDKLKFANGINIDETKISINEKDILNLATEKQLSSEDLNNAGKLKLQVYVNYFNVNYKLNRVNLVIETKSSVQINKYISNYDYNSIFLGGYKNIPPGISVNNFPNILKNMVYSALGSFADSFVTKSELNFDNVNQKNNQLTQIDLNDSGKLTLNITYDYGKIFNTFNVSLNVVKVDISKLNAISWIQQVIYLPREKFLTANDATMINQLLKNEIYTNLVNMSQASLSSYKITNQDYSLIPLNEFNAGQAVSDVNIIKFIFNIVANSHSKIITGNLINKAIMVNIFLTNNV